MTNKKGFTLIELLIVVIVIMGVFATISFSYYGSIKEKALDREAISNLKLIRDAERLCVTEKKIYYPVTGSVSDVSSINQNLSLMLSTGSSPNWNYTVKSTGCSQAARNGGNGRIWYLPVDNEEPTLGTCP